MAEPTTHTYWLPRRAVRKAVDAFASLPVRNGCLALLFIHLAVLLSGLEAVYVQIVTTNREFTFELLQTQSFLLLLCLDLLVPLTIAFLSRRMLFFYFAGQCFLSTMLLHYTIFFYNPLTLSTIYHSMHGAASLGVDIFGFARVDIILAMGAVFCVKALLLQLGRTPDWSMPRFWGLRGVLAVSCMAILWGISNFIYGHTGLSMLWVDSRGHRTATERRLETGTREAVRNIGYVATWVGEWLSGTYRDTALIYAEMRCADPNDAWCRDRERECAEEGDRFWNGIPVPVPGEKVILIQVESLDFATLDMQVNGHTVLPFLNHLARESVLLKAFAPHKVGSSNSDYEILNGRIADQNVIYYSYIKEYPDSIIRRLADKGYKPAMFHGLNGNLFNLREAYVAQGFDQLVFKEELLAEGYGPSRYIMDHVLDEDVFASAAKHLEQAQFQDRQAQFIVTMSSHVPFIDPYPIFKSVGGRFARYVSSLRYMDRCLAAYYARLPEGAVVILWGDHGSDVAYPRGFPDNARHVPFMVHVKGSTAWKEQQQQTSKKISARPKTLDSGDSNNLRAWMTDPDSASLVTSRRIYGLCDLAHYLRCIFR